jgi:coatomer protein complex subunit gamma
VQLYLEAGDFTTPFGFGHIVEVKETAASVAAAAAASGLVSAPAPDLGGSSAGVAAEINSALTLLKSIPELAELGPVFRSSKTIELTESESEYVVSLVKHIFESHVVFQFNITNTLDDQIIDGVTVELELGGDWVEELSVPCGPLATGVSGIAFVSVARPADSFTMDAAAAVLKYTLKDSEEDPGFADEYRLEDVELTESDFIKPSVAVNLLDFRRAWEGLADSGEALKKYALSMQDLQEAVNAVVEFVGLAPVEQSTRVPDGVQSHAVNLSGTFLGNVPVFARAGFMIDAKSQSVALKVRIRRYGRVIVYVVLLISALLWAFGLKQRELTCSLCLNLLLCTVWGILWLIWIEA